MRVTVDPELGRVLKQTSERALDEREVKRWVVGHHDVRRCLRALRAAALHSAGVHHVVLAANLCHVRCIEVAVELTERVERLP